MYESYLYIEPRTSRSHANEGHSIHVSVRVYVGSHCPSDRTIPTEEEGCPRRRREAISLTHLRTLAKSAQFTRIARTASF